MTAARPARPPPTTMVFGLAAMGDGTSGSCDLCGRMQRLPRPFKKSPDRRQPDCNKQHGDQHTDVAKAAAGAVSHRDPPFCREQPDAISKVPRRGNDPDGHKTPAPRDFQMT